MTWVSADVEAHVMVSLGVSGRGAWLAVSPASGDSAPASRGSPQSPVLPDNVHGWLAWPSGVSCSCIKPPCDSLLLLPTRVLGLLEQ